jgi:hypothetical protein
LGQKPHIGVPPPKKGVKNGLFRTDRQESRATRLMTPLRRGFYPPLFFEKPKKNRQDPEKNRKKQFCVENKSGFFFCCFFAFFRKNALFLPDHPIFIKNDEKRGKKRDFFFVTKIEKWSKIIRVLLEKKTAKTCPKTHTEKYAKNDPKMTKKHGFSRNPEPFIVKK